MKKIITSLVVAGLLLVGLRADAQIKPVEASLEKYKWKKRPLLLFSPSEDNPAYLRQKENIQADVQGLRERDMVVVELVGQEKVYIDGVLQRPGAAEAFSGAAGFICCAAGWQRRHREKQKYGACRPGRDLQPDRPDADAPAGGAQRHQLITLQHLQ